MKNFFALILITILGVSITAILKYRVISQNPIKYHETFIPLTYSDSTHFQVFLNKNVGNIIHFNTTISFDVSTDLNQRIHDACNYEEILDVMTESPNKIEQTPIGLPVFENNNDEIICKNQLIIKVKDPSRLRFSHGGTGIIHLPLRGNFSVEIHQHSGSITKFTLREI